MGIRSLAQERRAVRHALDLLARLPPDEVVLRVEEKPTKVLAEPYKAQKVLRVQTSEDLCTRNDTMSATPE